MSKSADINSIFETMQKINSLNVWKEAAGYNWVLKPLHSVYPYFFSAMYPADEEAFKAKILLLEGWQTMHDFVRHRIDPDAGYHSSYLEMAHFQLLFKKNRDIAFCRIDPGFRPYEPTPKQYDLLKRMLWEIYGVLLRIENEPSLVIKYAADRALFARVEVEPGVWRDEPMPLLEPPPYKEEIIIPMELINVAKKVPIDKQLRVVVDLRMDPYTITTNPGLPPKANYILTAIDVATGKVLVNDLVCVDPTCGGIKALWTDLPAHILKRFVKMNRLPCEILVVSGRAFRFLRALILQVPIRLTRKEGVPVLDDFFLKRRTDDICKIQEKMERDGLS